MVPFMEPLSDEELISRWREQAPSSEAQNLLNDLFQRHHARVALWCLRLTGDRESAAVARLWPARTHMGLQREWQ